MLEPLNFENIPNAQYIMEDFKNLEYDPKNLYSVPYTWGTVGILYNTSIIKETPDSWEDLWDEEYFDRILMYNNSRDTLGVALIKNGYSLNTINKDELQKACDDLIAQKDLLQA